MNIRGIPTLAKIFGLPVNTMRTIIRSFEKKTGQKLGVLTSKRTIIFNVEKFVKITGLTPVNNQGVK